MEVAEQDGCLRACDDQNDENKEDKSEHVVGLMSPAMIKLKTCSYMYSKPILPNAVQDEEQLQENCTEGEDGSENDSWQWPSVEALIRHLARNLIGSHRILNGL